MKPSTPEQKILPQPPMTREGVLFHLDVERLAWLDLRTRVERTHGRDAQLNHQLRVENLVIDGLLEKLLAYEVSDV